MRVYGALAQLGERRLCKPEVTGSIPVRSTKKPAGNGGFLFSGSCKWSSVFALERVWNVRLRPLLWPVCTRSSRQDDGRQSRVPQDGSLAGGQGRRTRALRVLARSQAPR